jgi:hypothetical protein
MSFKTKDDRRPDSPHLTSLRALLDDVDKARIYPCIQDLVANGLTLSRFADGAMRPTRQDITQFIAAWLRHIGIPSDRYSDWLVRYCIDVLSPISSSSPSQIRHSTRSNIKYIQRSEVDFECACEHNVFKADCSRDCPVYDEMEIRSKEPKKRELKQLSQSEMPPKEGASDIQELPVKEIYREQFEEGLKVIRENLRQGMAIKKMVDFLNDRGLKTRTGRNWTYAILNSEIHKHRLDTIEKD